MQLCNRIYYSKVCWRLNMFWAAHRSSSGALNFICSLWFTCPCGDWPLPRLRGIWINHPFPTQPWQWPVVKWAYKPEAGNKVQSSWWWAVCRSKHVEPLINFEIINSSTKLHLVGISTELGWEAWCSFLKWWYWVHSEPLVAADVWGVAKKWIYIMWALLLTVVWPGRHD
jgi:hypothetical protein